MELKHILHAENLDAYQKVLVMYLLDAQKRGVEEVFYSEIVKIMDCTPKTFREKVEPLLSLRWVIRGTKRGYYSLNRFPNLF